MFTFVCLVLVFCGFVCFGYCWFAIYGLNLNDFCWVNYVCFVLGWVCIWVWILLLLICCFGLLLYNCLLLSMWLYFLILVVCLCCFVGWFGVIVVWFSFVFLLWYDVDGSFLLVCYLVVCAWFTWIYSFALDFVGVYRLVCLLSWWVLCMLLILTWVFEVDIWFVCCIDSVVDWLFALCVSVRCLVYWFAWVCVSRLLFCVCFYGLVWFE